MQFTEHEAAFRCAANQLSRRDFLNRLGAGMGAIGLAGMLQPARSLGAMASSPLLPKLPHFAPRAKRVIQLFMPGGPSPVDTFDYKPMLAKHEGERMEIVDRRIGRQMHADSLAFAAVATHQIAVSANPLLAAITVDPEICHRKPCICGLRYPVESMLEYLSGGDSVEDVLAEFPDLERDDLLACFEFARQALAVRSQHLVLT